LICNHLFLYAYVVINRTQVYRKCYGIVKNKNHPPLPSELAPRIAASLSGSCEASTFTRPLNKGRRFFSMLFRTGAKRRPPALAIPPNRMMASGSEKTAKSANARPSRTAVTCPGSPANPRWPYNSSPLAAERRRSRRWSGRAADIDPDRIFLFHGLFSCLRCENGRSKSATKPNK